MREIDDARYSFRKPIDYDNDFAVLFYKGKKVARGLFEMFNIKYVGCNTLSSSICMDKIYSKIIHILLFSVIY